MSIYFGKICPFCKTEFKENDDIVVCSNCDMPHHKDCWVENQGCTTFGCTGTIKAAGGVSDTVTATELIYEDDSAASVIYCSKCGTKYSGDSAFCSRCGNRLKEPSAAPVCTQSNPANTDPYAYTQQNGTSQSAYTPQYQQNTTQYQQNTSSYDHNAYSQQASTVIDPDVEVLIGANKDYYVSKFQEMKSQNKKNTWNTAAFLVTPFWFIYRKMYGYGCGMFGGLFLISLIGVPFLSVLALGGYIVAGIFSNYIYMKWLEKHANQLKTMSEPYRTQYVQKNGGVNTVALVIAIVAWIVTITIISNI